MAVLCSRPSVFVFFFPFFFFIGFLYVCLELILLGFFNGSFAIGMTEYFIATRSRPSTSWLLFDRAGYTRIHCCVSEPFLF